jgi:hypothetical protein
MMTGKYHIFTVAGDTDPQECASLEEAQAIVERIVGNNRYTKPFPNAPTPLLYGPGDGTFSHIIRRARI